MNFSNRRNWKLETKLSIVITGIILIINIVINILKIESGIFENKYYEGFIIAMQIVFSMSVFILIIWTIIEIVMTKSMELLKHGVNKIIEQEREVSSENDLKIKEKQLRSKNTTVVFCENCGADNILTDTTGICKYCRTPLKTNINNNN